MRLRVATRGSALARWQADHVAVLAQKAGPGLEVETVVVETSGDRQRDVLIWELGGKGVFVKEVQAALLAGRADVAVHSAKDLPSLTPDGLVIGAVPERADVRDALVGSPLADLAPGATVASGSLRRRAQLAHARPDLRFEGLRGNIATRLARLERADVAAVVMAAPALDRLGLCEGVRQPPDPRARRARGGGGSWARSAAAARCRPPPTRPSPATASGSGRWWPRPTARPCCATSWRDRRRRVRRWDGPWPASCSTT